MAYNYSALACQFNFDPVEELPLHFGMEQISGKVVVSC